MNDFMRIDLSDFDNRKEEISKDLMKAASEHGFFYGNFHSFFFLKTHQCSLMIAKEKKIFFFAADKLFSGMMDRNCT